MRACREVVFVGGAGHSGSTLLGLMLGASPRVFYAGEARKSLFLGDESKPLKKRVCKLCGPGCPVWGDLVVPRGDDLYETLARRTGREVVVDSTKNVAWIERQLAALEGTGTERRMIFLARDGRAVVASRIRKYPEVGARAHAEAWRDQIRASEALAARFPGEVMRARYEELATRPEATVREVARFVGIELEPAMLAPWTTAQHPLGGNAGTQSLMGARQGAPAEGDLAGAKRAYYEAHPRSIVLDLRWKRETSAEDLAAFDEVAGEANAPYAWEGESAS